MNKFSKVIALALATTMVVGSTVTAFANDPSTTTPVTNGSSEGAGTSEGHVEKKATNVVLPTIPEGSTPFKYIMDPEGLIVETAGAKFDNVVFPASTGDTHVYFNNGTNSDSKTVYANSSLALEAINKSSHNIDLTIKAEVKDAAATDIPLVAQSAISTATAASLYLGLVVGTGDSESKTAIAADTAATKTVTIAGTAGNFKIAAKADKSGYEYRVLTLDEYKALDGNSAATALPWESESFKLEGETTEDKAITAATTAPKINVTWSWVDPDAAPTSYTVTYKSNYTDGPEDATEDVAANGNPTGPETAFTRTGYTLAGWATAADGEAAALSTYTITEATTLYAIWTEDKFFTAGASTGTVKFTASRVSEVTSIMMTNQYGEFDALHGVSGVYADATTATADGVTTITFDSAFNGFYSGNVDATITFKDASGTTKTETLTLNMGE